MITALMLLIFCLVIVGAILKLVFMVTWGVMRVFLKTGVVLVLMVIAAGVLLAGFFYFLLPVLAIVGVVYLIRHLANS